MWLTDLSTCSDEEVYLSDPSDDEDSKSVDVRIKPVPVYLPGLIICFVLLIMQGSMTAIL